MAWARRNTTSPAWVRRTPAVALQQRHADLFLQQRNRLADRGLGGVDGARRRRKTAVAHHFNEYPQMPDVHAVPEWMGFRQFILLMNSPGA
jgi:hypothetical protein